MASKTIQVDVHTTRQNIHVRAAKARRRCRRRCDADVAPTGPRAKRQRRCEPMEVSGAASPVGSVSSVMSANSVFTETNLRPSPSPPASSTLLCDMSMALLLPQVATILHQVCMKNLFTYVPMTLKQQQWLRVLDKKETVDMSKLACSLKIDVNLVPVEFMKFCSETVPTIALQDYIQRLVRYTQASEQALIVTLILLDKLVSSNKKMQLTWFNVHRLFLVTLLVSAKFVDDFYHSNLVYARSGGLPLPELNLMEVDLLFAHSFDVNIPVSVFDAYLRQVKMMALTSRDSSTAF